MLQINSDTKYRKDNVISVLKNNISNENLIQVLTTKGMVTQFLHAVKVTSYTMSNLHHSVEKSLPRRTSHLHCLHVFHICLAFQQPRWVNIARLSQRVSIFILQLHVVWLVGQSGAQ